MNTTGDYRRSMDNHSGGAGRQSSTGTLQARPSGC